MRRWALILCAVVVSGCHGPRAGAPLDAPDRAPAPQVELARAPSPVDVAHGPAPLEAPQPLVALAVPGFDDAVVSLPIGATGPRPVLVATHGNNDRPEWQCALWREIVGPDAFILCPRGEPRPDASPDDVRYWYPRNEVLEIETLAGLDALLERFPAHADTKDPVYAGCSLGAIEGVAIASRRGDDFSRLVLVEGGWDRWTLARARAFAAAGGRRVLMACSQPGCVHGAKDASRLLTAAGVEVREVHKKLGPHQCHGDVAEAAREAWTWVVADDPRWRPAAGQNTPHTSAGMQ